VVLKNLRMSKWRHLLTLFRKKKTSDQSVRIARQTKGGDPQKEIVRRRRIVDMRRRGAHRDRGKGPWTRVSTPLEEGQIAFGLEERVM